MICTKCKNHVVWFDAAKTKLTHDRGTPFKDRFHQPKVKEIVR